ncbi:MAG: PIG-L family deacetylase [Longimicrobiaceae bacterium]
MTLRPLAAAALLALALIPATPAPPLAAQEAIGEYRGAAALGLALRRLGTTRRVLMVGAHPDDENTALLAALALEDGADVAYLSLTRGDGGQNGIGPELGEALGVLRTEELLAARRVDGARQFFGRAYDFGFSKSADEAFRHWPRRELLADAVGVIRLWRPDVVIAVFSGTPRDGHGQHQVSAIIAREAFDAAGDSTAFPEQLRAGLAPFRPRKFYRSFFAPNDSATVRIAAGGLDPLVGRSPYQLAAASRSRHRSQDMGAPESAGPRFGYLVRRVPAPAAEPSIWAGLDTTLSARDPRFAAYDRTVAEIRASASVLDPGALVERLSAAAALLAAPGGSDDVRRAAADELGDVRRALALAAGIELDAVADAQRIVPGQEFGVEVSLWNGGTRAVSVDALEPLLPAGWTATRVDSAASTEVEGGAVLRRRYRVRVPADAAPTEPYFLRQPRDGDLYRWPDDWSVRARPFEPAPVRAAARVRVAGAGLPLEREATFRMVDPRQGELRRPVLVVPAVSVLLEPETSVLPTGRAPRPLRFRLRLTAAGPRPVSGAWRLALPAGWRAEPDGGRMTLAPGEPRGLEVSVIAPAGVRPAGFPVSAVFTADGGERYTRGLQLVDYPHIRARPIYHDAASTVRAFDVRVPAGLKVGYVTGAGEEGPGILSQLGITPAVLTADSLAGANLSRYDVIVTGIRAYEVRPDLAASNARLLEYVRNGGTLIVQYNKYEMVQGGFNPFSLTLASPHDRVTDEAAPVRVLQPASPVFTWPNRIGDADWEGWEQERGLYFAHTWAPEYTPLLEMHDPGEAPLRGGLLLAKYGRGTYVYTGLAFFRQLPAGVPGAWRLFANLLALGSKQPH